VSDQKPGELDPVQAYSDEAWAKYEEWKAHFHQAWDQFQRFDLLHREGHPVNEGNAGLDPTMQEFREVVLNIDPEVRAAFKAMLDLEEFFKVHTDHQTERRRVAKHQKKGLLLHLGDKDLPR
jgi:hypothetical protein